MGDTLQGSVERILFYAGETGFSVIRLKPALRSQVPQGALSRDGLATVVGELPEINPGESLRLTGSWITHSKHGRQFRADHCEQTLPATIEGLRRYLGSGLIRGIGKVMAQRIVDTFGQDTLEIIDNAPHRLREVPGIGRKRAKQIAQAWEAQQAIKEVMILLQSHKISTRLAVKIYKHYGDAAVEVVRTDPYRLARDIWGIGFKTADTIAQNIGLPFDSPTRIEAGLIYVLNQQVDDGHVYLPQVELLAQAEKLLSVGDEAIQAAILRLETQEQVRRGEPQADSVYLERLYWAEVGVADRLSQLAGTRGTRLQGLGGILIETGGDLALSDQQHRAVTAALISKVSILTGGPGTGKTTALHALIQTLNRHGRTFALCAPTGRAAKRMSEATGFPARTIHRLLEYSPTEGFKRNQENPLDVDMVIVDEASMLDLMLTHSLLRALDPLSHLLLVGDVDQLPSVGAGDVLRDIISSGVATVTRLDAIFRQAQTSLIITNAHRINQGETPLTQGAKDFFLFVEPDPDQAATLLVDIVKNRIPRKFGLNPQQDIQVLSPMYRGSTGVANLNQQLQLALNPPGAERPERSVGGRVFRVGDRLMQIRNNYDKDVFNGDIGRLIALDGVQQTAVIDYDGRRVQYDWIDLDEVVHAYAISVHKSQGSEYPAVVTPVSLQHYVMLQRNLLYTAVTRARKLVVLVGTRKAIAIAVRNNKVAHRYTGLSWRLARNVTGRARTAGQQ